MSDIPPEIISDILSRLPVISLLKFRCVSKPFKALIDSPKFIQAHFDHQALKPDKLIIKAHNKADNLFFLDFGSVSSTTQQQKHPKELNHPLKQLYGPTQVLGCCRGLVLISNTVSDNGVWNPSTKRFRRLPVCKFELSSRLPSGRRPGLTQICGGFGYDKVKDDFKVVTISQWYHPDDEPSLVCKVMVYSLRFGGWKKVRDCGYWLVKEENGTYAGGALYWIVTKEPSRRSSPLVLVGFDLGTERFDEVAFPEDLGKPLQLNLASLGERLCLVSGYVNGVSNVLDHVDVWMMKGYGGERSWFKMFSVEQLEGRQHFSFLRPITYSGTGKEVLLEMDNRKFLWYSLEKKSLKHAKFGGVLDPFESFASLGTLMPIYYGCGDGKDRKKETEERDDLVMDEKK